MNAEAKQSDDLEPKHLQHHGKVARAAAHNEKERNALIKQMYGRVDHTAAHPAGPILVVYKSLRATLTHAHEELQFQTCADVQARVGGQKLTYTADGR